MLLATCAGLMYGLACKTVLNSGVSPIIDACDITPVCPSQPFHASSHNFGVLLWEESEETPSESGYATDDRLESHFVHNIVFDDFQFAHGV
jgi:hypothetical protein